MSILLFAESQQGKLKKGSAELCSYGFALAQQQNTSLTIVTINCENVDQLTQYGASKLINLNVNVDYFEAHEPQNSRHLHLSLIHISEPTRPY